MSANIFDFMNPQTIFGSLASLESVLPSFLPKLPQPPFLPKLPFTQDSLPQDSYKNGLGVQLGQAEQAQAVNQIFLSNPTELTQGHPSNVIPRPETMNVNTKPTIIGDSYSSRDGQSSNQGDTANNADIFGSSYTQNTESGSVAPTKNTTAMF